MLDSVLVGAVFEQRISVLFIEDGVWQLAASQSTERSGLKNLSQQWRVLPEYDVDAIFVCARSLSQRRLKAAALSLPVTPLTLEQQQALIAAQDVVLND